MQVTEWECRDDHLAHAKAGRENGFLEKWLGLQTSSDAGVADAKFNRWTKLQGERLLFAEWEGVTASPEEREKFEDAADWKMVREIVIE